MLNEQFEEIVYKKSTLFYLFYFVMKFIYFFFRAILSSWCFKILSLISCVRVLIYCGVLILKNYNTTGP